MKNTRKGEEKKREECVNSETSESCAKGIMEVQDYEDLVKIDGDECRICLKPSIEFCELFLNEDAIARKLMAVASVQVKEGDGLPPVICLHCNQQLRASYDFKIQIENSDRKLRKLIDYQASDHSQSSNIVKAIIADVISNVISCETKDVEKELIKTQDLFTKNTEFDSDLLDSKKSSNEESSVLVNSQSLPTTRLFSELKHEKTIDNGSPEIINTKRIEPKDLIFNEANLLKDVENSETTNDEMITSELLYTHNNILKDKNPLDSLNSNVTTIARVQDTQVNTIKQEELIIDSTQDVLNTDTFDQKSDVLEGSPKISRVEGLQDDEEKPLISRTTRLRCTQCIKSIRKLNCGMARKRKTKLRYVCHLCEKQYSSINKLKNHINICHERKIENLDEQLKVDTIIVQDKATENKDDDIKMERLIDEEKNVQLERITDQDNKELKLQGKRIRNTQNSRRNLSGLKEDRKGFRFVCKICSKRFIYQKSFVSHSKTHPEYEMECLKDATRSANKEKPIQYSEEEEMEEDEEEDEDDEEDMPEESLQCTQCGKLFATKRNLKRHISTHSGLKYNCGTCGKGFSRVDKLKDHEQSKHKHEIFESSDPEDKEDVDPAEKGNYAGGRKKERHSRPYKCALCPKSFAQAQSLANHTERHKRVKETQKRFLCEVCSKCFAQSGSLVAHMRTHTGVKPYVCNVCSRAFTKSTYLQLHLRTHSGEKPYICQYCSRAFARANTLARHITMHTGEAKYHCQICTKSFRRLTSLNEHTYTHTGQRPYACKICTKRYNNAGSLYAHRKKCKAQQLSSGFTVSLENSGQEQDNNVSQYMIHNPKGISGNIGQPFTVDDPNVYGKQFKNPYYTIYPNM